MNLSTIVQVLPGQKAPEEYLKKVLTVCPSIFGFALRLKDTTAIVHEILTTSVDLKTLNELMDNSTVAGGDLVMFFSNLAQGNRETDGQPFVFAVGEGDEAEPHLAIFTEGDLSAFSVEGHTEEYNYSDEVLFPRISKAWDDTGDAGVEKFFDIMRSDRVKNTLLGSFKHRGVIIMLPSIGDVIAYGHNEIGGTFKWGNVSNAHGYEEKAPAVPVVAQVKKGGLSFLNKAAKAVVEMTQEPELPLKEGVDPATVKDIPLVPPTETSSTLVEVFCPSKLTGGAKNYWLRLFNGKDVGELPANHQSNKVSVWVEPGLVVLAKRDVSTTKDVKLLAEDVRKARTGAPVDMRAAHEQLEKEDKPITGRSTVREKAPASNDYLPVLSKEEKEKAMGHVASYLDIKSEKRPSPLEIQKLESKWPAFSSEIGVNFEELLFLPVDQLVKIFDGNKIAACAFIEMRTKYIQTSGIKLEDLVGKKLTTTEKHVIAKEELAPKKSGALSFLRKTG